MVNQIKEDGVVTLADLVYRLRDSIGELKDNVLGSINSGITQETLLTKIVDRSYLNKIQQRILESLDLITEDPHYQRLSSQEKTEMDNKVLALKQEVIKFGFVSQLKDLPEISKQAKFVYEKLSFNSLEDRLTGLPNKYLFEIKADQKISDYIDNPNKQLSLAFIDLNNFSKYNNLIDHDQADLVLAFFAKGLKEIPEVIPARRSGDEFLLMAHNPDAEGTELILRKKLIPYVENEWLTKVKEKMGPTYNSAFEENGYRLSISIGVTSTSLSHGRPFYQRLSHFIKKQLNENADNYPEIDIGQIIRKTSNADQPGYMINQMLRTAENRTLFRNFFYQMMVFEAEKAMHLAKNTRADLNENKISIYNPTLQRDTYVYHRK